MFKRILLNSLFVGLAIFSHQATAGPIDVTYAVGDYSHGNYSASVLHGATGCNGSNGPDTGSPLFMCGKPHLDVEGTISGTLDSGVLTITGGILSIDGTDYDVLGGMLGAFGGTDIWSIVIESYGKFLFENIDMGSGRPNFFDGDTLILWGQNEAAYACDPTEWINGDLRDCSTFNRWGADLYGERMPVPEPGTLALLAVGLFGMALVRHRRLAYSSRV